VKENLGIFGIFVGVFANSILFIIFLKLKISIKIKILNYYNIFILQVYRIKMWSRFILYNFAVVLLIFLFATEEDMKALPGINEPVSRFINIVYFLATMMTTVGFGDITPTSTRAKALVTTYMLTLFYIVVNEVSIYKPKIPSNF